MNLLMKVGSLGLPLLNMILNRFGWGIADYTLGVDGYYYRGHYCVYIIAECQNGETIAAGDLVSWSTAQPSYIIKRASNARMPAGVALDSITSAAVGQLIRVAQWGYCDVAWNGGDRNAVADYCQAGDVAAQYHITKLAYGAFQVGHTGSKAGATYYGDGTLVRVYVNLNSR